VVLKVITAAELVEETMQLLVAEVEEPQEHLHQDLVEAEAQVEQV
jgi:hypothetical protein